MRITEAGFGAGARGGLGPSWVSTKETRAMKEARGYLEEIRTNVEKIRRRGKVTPAENALLGMVDGLAGLQYQLMERVAALEAAASGTAVRTKPAGKGTTRARRGLPGMRPEVDRDPAGRSTGEPKRTERATGRNNRKTTDIDRGIV